MATSVPILVLKSDLNKHNLSEKAYPIHGSKGGICVIHRSSARISLNDAKTFSSFELMDFNIRFSPASVLRVYAIYRPPPSSQNKLTYSMFASEFFTLLESAAIAETCPVIIGDFNIHVDNSCDSHAKSFLSSLESLGFQQHVKEATHRAGHTLDLIISRKVDDTVSCLNLISGLPSDHSMIITTINTTGSKNPRKRITFRKLRSIDISSFQQDINTSSIGSSLSSHLSTAVDVFNETLIQLLDKHAPAESKVITIKPYAPWYNEEVREAKRCRRRAERRMVKSGLCIHKQLYKKECEAYYNILFEAKSKYLKCEIKESNTKQLFEVVKRLSTPNRSAALPDHSSDEDLANNFGEFFENKISSIVSSFDDSSHEFSCVPAQPGISPDCNLSEFDPVPESRVKSLIKSLSSKSSSLDPIPTWLPDLSLELKNQIISAQSYSPFTGYRSKTESSSKFSFSFSKSTTTSHHPTFKILFLSTLHPHPPQPDVFVPPPLPIFSYPLDLVPTHVMVIVPFPLLLLNYGTIFPSASDKPIH
ncbi:uncharacterized protein [Diadema setosum]|uniref:uncharacterized protein n=1 Tax=Diadema setosum TaxID=31175 RepID=UPI003B3BA61C